MPITQQGTAAQPVHISQNNDVDCTAAKITVFASILAAILWYGQRHQALKNQETIENEILDIFGYDVDQYLDHDHQRQLDSINAALNVADCEKTCSDCTVEVEIDTTFTRCVAPILALQKQAYMVAKGNDKVAARARYSACTQNKNNTMLKGLNLAYQTYSNYYQFLANASTIQGSLAGMAGAAYAQSVSELSYALTLLGRGRQNGNMGLT